MAHKPEGLKTTVKSHSPFNTAPKPMAPNPRATKRGTLSGRLSRPDAFPIKRETPNERLK